MTVARRILLALALGVALAAPAPAAQNGTAGIVFVGSSIFHRWTNLAAQMAPLPITNLAIDGTQTFDMLRMVGSRVIFCPIVLSMSSCSETFVRVPLASRV